MNNIYKRIEWIDIAKGIAIMLVVIAHTINYGNTGPIIKSVIYSFHMPFFFIMSGVTAVLPTTMDEFWEKTKRLTISLIVPAYVAYICRFIFNLFIDKPNDICLDDLLNHIYTLLYITPIKLQNLQLVTYSFGAVWFLIVLFLYRTILGYLNLIMSKQQLLFTTCLLSLIGYIAGQQSHMIFAFDIVLTVLPLCLTGQYIKKLNLSEFPVRYGLYAFLVWTIGFFITHPNPRNTAILNIFSREYPLYPLCFFTAIAGTIFLCCCCIVFSKLCISKFFSFVGKHSLIYLLVHYFDFIWKPLWDYPSDQYIKTLLRLLTNTVVFLVIMLLKYILKKVQIYFRKTPKGV